MQKPTVVLLLVALVAVIAGALIVPQLLQEPEAPIMQWSADDEVDGSIEAVPEAANVDEDAFERAEVEPVGAAAADFGTDERIDAILRGRVINKFQQPVAGASVWLEFGRGGAAGRRGNRPRRIPDPVQTDAEGRFAFQGQTFRNLRVSLQVKHKNHALGLFDKDIGRIATDAGAGAASAEIELGNLVLKSGGEVRGRIIDLDGIGVASAEITLEPDNRNPLRWQRNREELVPALTTDANGFYVYPHVTEGDFTITAIAKRHTEGRSAGFTVEEDQVVDVPDIMLGPGYELSGYVRTSRGEPIAQADVVLRSTRSRGNAPDGNPAANAGQPQGRQDGARMAFGGRGRDFRTKTDETGLFFLQHLPGSLFELRVDARGFLDYAEDEIDARFGQVLNVAMEDGLRITGIVQSPSGEPVTSYALRAVRLRALPDPSLPSIDLNELMARMRDGNIDDATRNQLRRQMQSMRESMGGGRGGRQGGPGQGGPGQGRRGGGGDAGQPESHPDGTFVAGGLQEGIYEVDVEAPDYARYRSAEIEVRKGAAAPELVVSLDPGVYVAGAVLDERGSPIAGATVELRSEAPPTANQEAPAATGGMPDLNRMTRDWARMAAGASVRLEARTDADGLFFIRHVGRGYYRLSANADGFTDARTEPFELTADRQGFELRLGLLGSLTGTVSGFAASDIGQVQVGAVVVPEAGAGGMLNLLGGRGGRGGPRGFRTVEVQPDGSYQIDGMAPGNYVVRSWLGSPQQLMREIGPQLFDGSLQPDVAIRGGEETRWDPVLTRPQLGVVSGAVMHNGEHANGFRVELTPENNDQDQTAPPAYGGRGGGRGGRARFTNFGRTYQATVSASGRFQIEDVPAGLYTLRVTAGRRGAALLEEQVQVVADVTLERSYSVITSSLRATITRDDGGDPKELGGRASLLPGATQVPENLNAWLRQNTSFDARVQDGGFTIDSLPPGNYLLVLQLRNRENTSMQVTVQGERTISVMAGKPTSGG